MNITSTELVRIAQDISKLANKIEIEERTAESINTKRNYIVKINEWETKLYSQNIDVFA